MNGILLISMPGSGEWFYILFFAFFWLWALVDCLQGTFKNDTKLLWILLIVLLPGLGMLAYFLIGRGQKVSAAR